MNKYKIIVILAFISTHCFPANDRIDLAVTNIPDSLKKNAYAVIVNSSTTFEYKSLTSGFEKISNTITILDKKGDDIADFTCPIDKFRELKNFKGQLFDAQGRLLRKYKMSDLKSTEYSLELASDNKYFYMDIDLPTYPVTIVYEYEINWKNGILAFPVFNPQDEHNLSVLNATYKLTMPINTEISYKAVNITKKEVISSTEDITSYEWTVNNLCAIENEQFSPALNELTPKLYSNPRKFIYDGIPGEINNWETMGTWQYNLNNGRNILSNETKNKIIEMTRDAKSDKEKVRILYNYLGKTTRYVSIQLGIGGLQPIPASEVCKTGFGDCKGLSNYLKAMLDVIGIPSNYTVICLDKTRKSLFQDYANFYQTNHVILQVPLLNDTLWLECTNPRIPFGFIHNGISGHDALVNTQTNSKLYKLTDYPDSLNTEKNYVNVLLKEDGSADVSMSKDCKLKIYDNFDWFPLAKSNEQADKLREEIKLPSVTMGPVKVKEDKAALPSLNIDYSWSTPLYGNKTGSRLFIPVNPYRSFVDGLKKSKRVHDINVSAGFKDIDSIYITIPESYEIENMPTSHVLKTSFGNFESNIKKQDKGILIQHTLFIPSGEYKVTDYPDFVAFFEKINNAYKSTIILRKRST